jgi:hypothetical protein
MLVRIGGITMNTFVAIYRGRTIAEARLVALSADPQLVADVSARILHERQAGDEPDPVIGHLERGRKAALRPIQREVTQEP